MEASTIITIISTLLGGGVVLYLVRRFLPSRADNAETKEKEQSADQKQLETEIKEQSAVIDFGKKIREAVKEQTEIEMKALNDKMDYERKLAKSESEKINLMTMMEFKDGLIRDNAETLKSIHIEMGAAQERERTCQRELSQVRVEMSQMRLQFEQK